MNLLLLSFCYLLVALRDDVNRLRTERDALTSQLLNLSLYLFIMIIIIYDKPNFLYPLKIYLFEKNSKKGQRSDLESKIQQLRNEQQAFNEQRANFDRDQRRLEEQRNELVESVQRLQRENAELKLISERLKQSSVSESLGPPQSNANDFVQKLRPTQLLSSSSFDEQSVGKQTKSNNNKLLQNNNELNIDPEQNEAKLTIAAEQVSLLLQLEKKLNCCCS